MDIHQLLQIRIDIPTGSQLRKRGTRQMQIEQLFSNSARFHSKARKRPSERPDHILRQGAIVMQNRNDVHPPEL